MKRVILILSVFVLLAGCAKSGDNDSHFNESFLPTTEAAEREVVDLTASWRSEYENVLNEYCSSEEYIENAAFSLYDMDNDDVPELIISKSTSSNSPCHVYSFDGEVVSLGEIGEYGCIGYSEKLDLISSYILKQGHEYEIFYKLSEYDTFELENVFYNNRGAAVTDKDLIYKINDEQVDFKEYQSEFEEYDDEAKVCLGRDYKLTVEEIEKAFSEYISNEKTMLTQETAAELLWSFIGTNGENQHLSYEYTEYYNEQQCYVFRHYNDFETHRATLGWYAVNSETGECYNTNALTEWKKMSLQ